MVKTRAEELLELRQNSPPLASSQMVKQVSQYRRAGLEEEFEQGGYREHSLESAYQMPRKFGKELPTGPTQAGFAIGSSKGFLKSAQAALTGGPNSGGVVGSGAGGFRGPGGTVRQTPDIYSPLWLLSNLNLPRDRATINAWCRSFFALNPIVHNSITLHSTYPIAKLNIKCKNQKVEKFFAQMNEELGLMNICSQIAQEYWTLGEVFPYCELDERTAKWSRIIIQNPDYITVRRSVIAGEPIISLRPDENLRRIVFGNRPVDVQQRRQLDPAIVEHIRKGENIPLNNFYVSHLSRKISPYEIRGTGLIVSCFRPLMLFDKLREAKFVQAGNMINPTTLVKIGSQEFRPTPADLEQYREIFECHDEETEVLTDQGFKKFDEVIEYCEMMDGTYGQSHITYCQPKAGFKIACFNQENEQLEYHEPMKASLYNYDGEMYHFNNEKMDIKVTPNHKMWVQTQKYKKENGKRKSYWAEWDKIEAQDLKFFDRRFRSLVRWEGDDTVKSVKIGEKEVPIELYLEFLGYVISEGCVYTNGRSQNTVGISQSIIRKKGEKNDKYPLMKKCVEDLSKVLDKSFSEQVRPRPEEDQEIMWYAIFSGQDIFNHFKDAVETSDGFKSYAKAIPRWVFGLSPRLLNILLDALVAGDGSEYDRPVNKDLKGFAYYTSSKQLADDVFELVYKAGFVPISFIRDDENYLNSGRAKDQKRPQHVISWSNSNKGNYPLVCKYSKDSKTKKKTPTFSKEKYNGKVWCFTVPTGLFITRRNGKITIQANSGQYDPDFKIFTHQDVTVERIGWNQGILDTSADITQLIKEIYIGLMVPSVIMDGSDTTYATGSVALDVLRQRYMQFRNMLSSWLRNHIFAPISKLNDFYDYEGGEKRLIVPEVDWNHMSLFDMADYIQNLAQLAQGEGAAKRISLQTLYRSLGLEYEDEQRKMRYEDIQDAIRTKEIVSLNNLSLNVLRSLNSSDEIPEPTEDLLPGEDDPNDLPGTPSSGGGGDMSGGGGLGGLSLPPPPGSSAPQKPVGVSIPSQPSGGGNSGIGPGGVPKPPSPS